VFQWFLARTICKFRFTTQPRADAATAFIPTRERKPGAESTLSFLMALLEMQEAKVTNAEETHQEMSISIESSYDQAALPSPGFGTTEAGNRNLRCSSATR